jgi:hypothetical protein
MQLLILLNLISGTAHNEKMFSVNPLYLSDIEIGAEGSVLHHPSTFQTNVNFSFHHFYNSIQSIKPPKCVHYFCRPSAFMFPQR